MDPEQEPIQYRCKNCRKPFFKEYVHSGENCTSYFINKPSWLIVDDLEN